MVCGLLIDSLAREKLGKPGYWFLQKKGITSGGNLQKYPSKY